MGKDSRNYIKARLKEMRAQDLAKMLDVTRRTIVAVEKRRYQSFPIISVKNGKEAWLESKRYIHV